VQTLPCKKEKGRIAVEETLAVPGFPGVWALGDCAWIPNPKTGQPHPPTAQHAIREAVQCAKNIASMVRGEPLRPFRFTTLGQLASIGHHIGVAQVFGINFSGFSAWLMWRLIYLAKLPRFEKKMRVALGWSLDLFFSKDLSQPLTLHGADRVQRRLAYVREHPFQPE
jgi:NADH dehydrogenase